MMLNSEQILERGILKLEHSKGKSTQVGYDLSLKSINQILGTGEVLKDKTNLPVYFPLKKDLNKDGWSLKPGIYEVEFWEGCNIPNNLVGLIRQRSSMMRCGATLNSSIFDPGFETLNMGSFITVFHPIFLEANSRIAQIYFHECEPVAQDNLYGGKNSQSQFQFDNQRQTI